MDLTSLSSTLPRSNTSTDDPEEPTSSMLLAAFKQTALAVTTLYKTAANETERCRREGRIEGYQDCLDDFLAFAEKVEGRSDTKTIEMLRQWALSKRRKTSGGGGGNKPRSRREDQEESAELDPEDLPTTTTTVMEEPPLPPQPAPVPQPVAVKSPRQPPPSVFSFRSNLDLSCHIQPSSKFEDIDIPDTDLCSPPTSPTLTGHTNIFQTRTVDPMGFRLGTPSAGRVMQQRAGSKRRIGSLGDFFDIAGMEKMQLEQKRRRYQ